MAEPTAGIAGMRNQWLAMATGIVVRPDPAAKNAVDDAVSQARRLESPEVSGVIVLDPNAETEGTP